eukprot:CAMPEP_0178908240 /NCGR_PEP_ID=MMETSP0786-20121207/7813_1 /TAXON_ID=186022 /ORGANISM="Thalassionema frauenfeldii, Strain CCMP 1798" /LENGTH=559 /DNA_ID=CAMNT_0020580121 /DNA_START=77 /DNA_END=1753 /DNA_ORIENTATION=-
MPLNAVLLPPLVDRSLHQKSTQSPQNEHQNQNQCNIMTVPLKDDDDRINNNRRKRKHKKKHAKNSEEKYAADNICDGDIDKIRIYRAAEEAGLHSFGIIGVDVWLLDARGESFIHYTLWVNPIFRAQVKGDDLLDRVELPSHPRYVVPAPQVPGAGLAGYFWSLGWSECTTAASSSTSPQSLQQSSSQLVWRDLSAIVSDPMQPPYERLKAMSEAGFGKATGLAFNIMGHRGVVIYLARPTACEYKLNDPTNVYYLRTAAQHIGTASALTRPRLDSARARKKRSQQTFRRVRVRSTCRQVFVNLRRSVKSFSNMTPLFDHDEISIHYSMHCQSNPKGFDSIRNVVHAIIQRVQKLFMKWCQRARKMTTTRLSSVLSKCRGSENVQPPPPTPWTNAAWSFFGAYLTALALCGLKHVGIYLSNGTESMPLAPFGALITLLYSLTAAPAAQPRTIIYGQCICLVVALTVQYVLLERAKWSHTMAVSLAMASGIALMTKTGFAHPPAAASIIALFASSSDIHNNSSKFGILSCTLVLMGNFIAIFMASIINNLSEQRQYPIYW